MTAVIYARYSSDAQNEQSIEGQLKDCYSYAEDKKITIIGQYIDRAKTGLSDDRPEFQRMISDASNGAFDTVLVWKFDRFSRREFDFLKYEADLLEHGVRVVSAMENVGEGSAAIITKGIYRIMAEYYSADLREKVVRGMRMSASKSKSTGGTVPYGYKLIDGQLTIDPAEAEVVKIVFESYANGISPFNIAEDLNNKGYRTKKGQPFSKNSFQVMLRNRKYIGDYHYSDIINKGTVPAIIDPDLFEAVQKRFSTGQHKGARNKARVPYLLSGKLFCGLCGAPISGHGGKSGYNYYLCTRKQKYRDCTLKPIKKEPLEELILREAYKLLTDDMIDWIVEEAQAENDRVDEDLNRIRMIENQISELQKANDNLVAALAFGRSETVISKILENENRIGQLENSKSSIIATRKAFNAEDFRQFLYSLKNGQISDEGFQRVIIDVFVEKVVLTENTAAVVFSYGKNKNAAKPEEVILDLTAMVHHNGSNIRFFPGFFVVGFDR